MPELSAGNLILVWIIALSAASVLALRMRRQELGEMLSAACLLLSAAALGYLSYLFLISDFTYAYVYSYSSKMLPWYYKLSGVWAGQEGTYLLWMGVIYLCIIFIVRRAREPLFLNAVTLLHALAAYLTLLALLESPFRRIYELGVPQGFVPVDGFGMNPLLQDPWMAAHPPLMFIAYGTAAVPFAFAVAHLWRGERGWIEPCLPWARIAWVFLTLGIAVGGFWSYKVLGWGGYWAWDPVETSSLIPWLTLTAFLHAASRHRRGEFPIFTPALAVVTFALVVYATYVTRSGSWESIHAFGRSTTGSYLTLLLLNVPLLPGILLASAKLGRYGRQARAAVLSLLTAQGALVAYKLATSTHELSYLQALAVLLLGALLYPLMLRRAGDAPELRGTSEESEHSNLMYLASVSLLLLAFVSFWGVTYPVLMQLFRQSRVRVEIEFFNTWSYPFTLFLMVVMALCLSMGLLSRRERIVGVAGALALGVLSLAVELNPSRMVSFIMPLLIYVLLLSLWLVGRSLVAGKNLRRAGVFTVHAGIALILLSSMLNTTLVVEREVVFYYSPEQGLLREVKDVGAGYGVELQDVVVYENALGEMVTEALVKVYRNGRYVGEGSAKMINNQDFGRITRVYINRNLDTDVYVIFQGVGSHSGGVITIPLTVKLEPLVNFLWAGIAMLCIGMLPLLLEGRRRGASL